MSTEHKKPYKIGITGGIACGKSVVRKILDNLNIPTLDADEIVHDILKNDQLIIQKLIDLFGKVVLDDEDNSIERKELARIVFADINKLKQLEAIIHPYTYEKIKTFLNESNSDIVAVVIPLLFENNRQYMFDSVWLVDAAEEEQINRLKLRDNMHEDEAKQRIAAQMPQHLKRAMADVVIENNLSIEDMQNAVEGLIA
ncbi:MAG: dephospho-CoA kinase, partial [Cyanobacteriota bacterium]